MAFNKAVGAVLKALSYGNIEVEAARKLADLKRMDPMRIFVKKADKEIYNDGYLIPVRLYFPTEEAMEREEQEVYQGKVLLFFHGGGWVTESVENYDRVCARMAQSTGNLVVSVEYRLAPEFRFPVGLTDCYEAAKALFEKKFLPGVKEEDITLMGDSAGGNLTASVCLMARDRGEFMPARQILIYPALWNDYTDTSPFPSVHENGTDYLLTSKKMEDYLNLYQRTIKDRENPYFAPLMEKDLTNQPKTLILTAQYDPLRDEGEEYARRLKEAGNDVKAVRIAGALHGYFALGIKYLHVQESFEIMNEFLREGWPCSDQIPGVGEN